MDSHLLLTHKREKGVVDQGATNSLRCLLEQAIQFLDMVATADTDELQHGLVIL